ncbi:sirohydrochlorin chelatase [Marinomonas sp. 2405UD68-3]|uniref:sirohydrochlorin chelatase n=1 Tax=Marinomonas sp. 2405UD68-3 TaxID=3391835 RepID=UPI0039C96D25
MTFSGFDHVILLAHGSTDPLWKLPFEIIYEKIVSASPREKCSLAYMELSEPSLKSTINALDASVKKVAVLPLFFSVGRHLRHDVPAMIKDLQRDDLSIELLAPIGDDDRIQKAMVDAVKGHLGETQ